VGSNSIGVSEVRSAQQVGNKLGAKRDSLPRSEEGVWGMRRSIP
jgi:hypothetical protein